MKKNYFKLLMKQKFFLSTVVASCLSLATAIAQPITGTTGFNNQAFDQVPFALGSAYPNVLNALNVASSGWNFHIGALGVYQITQLDKGTGAYDGAITASNLTPGGQSLYQTFAFTSVGAGRFKLNSVKVKIRNTGNTPIPMFLAGVVVGAQTGSTITFLAMPGTNWYTLNTANNPNFYYINGVISINPTGTTAVGEMAFDDIDISAGINTGTPAAFTTHPSNKSVCAGTSTTFSGVATNAVSYSWLMSTDGLIWNQISAANAGTTFSGYNTNTLTINNPSIALNGLKLGLVALNASGVSTGSNSATLTVNAVPTVPAIGGANSVCVGSTTTLTNAMNGGTWSSLYGRANVNNSGVVTGTAAGVATIRYTVTVNGCSNAATKLVTVNALPAPPSISTGTPAPVRSGGAFCANKTFTLAGSPAGGAWSSTGTISVTNAGSVNTGTVASNGNSVTYTYTDANGCSSLRTITGNVVICASKGVAGSLTTDSKFKVYPNPSRNTVNVNIETLVGQGQLVITDLFGKQIKSQNLSMGTNSMDVSSLAKGYYLVSIVTKESKTTEKLLVQ